MININDLNKRRREKKRRDTEIFDRVLKRSHIRIRMSANQLETACFYEVPSYIPGLPLFDRLACVRFLKKKLRENGFKVKLIGMSKLYISWKHIPVDEVDEGGIESPYRATESSTSRSHTSTHRQTIHPSNNTHPSHLSFQQSKNDSSDIYRNIDDELVRADAILFNMK